MSKDIWESGFLQYGKVLLSDMAMLALTETILL